MNNISNKALFVFDIETIPDTSVVENLLGENIEDVEKARKALEDYHLKITDGKNAFLRQPFHKIVAVSYVLAEPSFEEDTGQKFYKIRHIRSGGQEASQEQDLVYGFFKLVDDKLPTLVSFNGRTFDIPVLKYRAMKYANKFTKFFKEGTKWDSYSSRYSPDWHCDLLDVLSDFGSSARIKLNEVCSILGLPGKFGTDGSEVTRLYDEGKIKEIRDYCETDALNTYLLYLRYALMIGKINKDSYNFSIDDALKFIESSEKKHLLEFLDAWNTACKGEYFVG